MLNNNYPIVEFLSGKTHQIKSSIYHLMRGEVFIIENKTFFCFGGAESHDKEYRREYLSWWREEIPSWAEVENGYNNLGRYNYNVDYVLTHTAPLGVVRCPNSDFQKNPVTTMLDDLNTKIHCKKWLFGHHHLDIDIDDKFMCLYNRIILL